MKRTHAIIPRLAVLILLGALLAYWGLSASGLPITPLAYITVTLAISVLLIIAFTLYGRLVNVDFFGLFARPPKRGEQAVTVFDRSGALASLIILVVAVSLGVAAAQYNPILTPAASAEGQRVDRLFDLLLGVATVIFVTVQGALIYSVIRFRRRPGDRSDSLPVHGNNALETFWTVVPALIVTIIAIYSYQVLAENEATQPDKLVVEVDAWQFGWEFYYPELDVTTNELHLPVNRQVRLDLRSRDVIHSFWVPEFRVKMDALPARVTQVRFTPLETGEFDVVCAELCGVGHAIMRAKVIVHTPAGYEAWMAGISEPTAQPVDSFDLGRQVFVRYACGACHTLSNAGTESVIGPDLTGMGARAGDTIPGVAAEEYLRMAIVEPEAYLVEGFAAGIMPQTYGEQLSDAELEALIQYLLAQ